MIEAEQLHARVLEELDLTREVEDEELTRIIHHVLKEAGEREYMSLSDRTALGRDLFNAFRKLDLLHALCKTIQISIKIIGFLI